MTEILSLSDFVEYINLECIKSQYEIKLKLMEINMLNTKTMELVNIKNSQQQISDDGIVTYPGYNDVKYILPQSISFTENVYTVKIVNNVLYLYLVIDSETQKLLCTFNFDVIGQSFDNTQPIDIYQSNYIIIGSLIFRILKY